MRRGPRLLLPLLAATTTAACVDRPEPDPAGTCTREIQALVPVPTTEQLDLVIVIDRSPSMEDDDPRLAANLRRFGDVLEQLEGGGPDLHVAVITSDLGGRGVPGCTSTGDRGAFAGGARCDVTDDFLARRIDAAGRVSRNHPGTLGEALACVGELPRSTCAVSQPLGALVRALDGSLAGNDGFRRPDAYLMFVIISDADDCSLVDADALTDLADGSDDAVDRACRERPAALADVGATVAFLRPAPAMLVGSVVGPPAALAPRLASLAAALPERFAGAEIAAENWSDALSQLGWWTFPINRCADVGLDLDPAVPGTQATCAASIVDGLGGETVAPLPWCRDEPDGACLRIVEDPDRCPESGAYFDIDPRGATGLRGAVADIRCALACDPR